MMKIFRLLPVLFSICCFSGPIHALSLDEVNLMETSSSSKSVVIDRGLLENYTDGSYAKFFVQTGDIDFPKIFLVAEGKLIKSFPKKSFWYMSTVYLPKLIKSGNKLLVLTSNQIKIGRTFTQKQRHVLVSPDQYGSVEEYLDKNQNDVPSRLIQDLDSYEASDELFETKNVPEADQLVQTYESLRKKSGIRFSDHYSDDLDEKFFIGNRRVELANIKNKEDKKLLDSLALGYIEKINSQKYGLTNGLYKNQKKAPGIHEINDQITITSVYDNAKEEKRGHDIIDPKAIGKIQRDGAHWSEDMDDETLRRYFIRTGLEHEYRRRELAFNELDGNEILFHYSGSLLDHTTSSDQNYRNLGYSLGLAYDLHLSRTAKNLKDWSLQFQLEKGVSDYDIGGQNARGEEGSYGAYVNYYFINNPLTLNSFIFLGGLGIKAGSVSMSNSTLSKDYSYQVLVMPALQMMTKYRFRSGDLTEDTANIGASFNAGVTLDMKRLSVIDSLSDDINGKISMTDIKYIIGMGFYF